MHALNLASALPQGEPVAAACLGTLECVVAPLQALRAAAPPSNGVRGRGRAVARWTLRLLRSGHRPRTRARPRV